MSTGPNLAHLSRPKPSCVRIFQTPVPRSSRAISANCSTTWFTTILYSTPASPTSPSLQSSCATSAVKALPKRKRSSRSCSVSPADAAGCSGAPTSTGPATTGKRHRLTDFTTPASRSFSIRKRFLPNRQNSRLSRFSENQDHGPRRQLLAKQPERRDFSFSGKTATMGHPLTFSRTVHLADFSVFEENWGSAQVARFSANPPTGRFCQNRLIATLFSFRRKPGFRAYVPIFRKLTDRPLFPKLAPSPLFEKNRDSAPTQDSAPTRVSENSPPDPFFQNRHTGIAWRFSSMSTTTTLKRDPDSGQSKATASPRPRRSPDSPSPYTEGPARPARTATSSARPSTRASAKRTGSPRWKTGASTRHRHRRPLPTNLTTGHSATPSWSKPRHVRPHRSRSLRDPPAPVPGGGSTLRPDLPGRRPTLQGRVRDAVQGGRINSGEAVAIESAHIILCGQGKDTGPRDLLVTATPRATLPYPQHLRPDPHHPRDTHGHWTTPRSLPTTVPSTCFGRRNPCNTCHPYSEDRRLHRSTSSAPGTTAPATRTRVRIWSNRRSGTRFSSPARPPSSKMPT